MIKCPKCGSEVLDSIGAGRCFRWLRLLTCDCCHVRFDALVESGRVGGRQRKPFTDEELQRRRELLAEVRKRRWPKSATSKPLTESSGP